MKNSAEDLKPAYKQLPSPTPYAALNELDIQGNHALQFNSLMYTNDLKNNTKH